MFCGLVIFIKNFDPINIRRPCAHKITMFCSEVMMIKSFNPIKSRRPWPPISISHLFQQGPFSSWPLLFLHLGCFCLDYNYCTNHIYASIAHDYFIILVTAILYWDSNCFIFTLVLLAFILILWKGSESCIGKAVKQVSSQMILPVCNTRWIFIKSQ